MKTIKINPIENDKFELVVIWETWRMKYITWWFSLYHNKLTIKERFFLLNEWDKVYKWKRLLYDNDWGHSKTYWYLKALNRHKWKKSI